MKDYKTFTIFSQKLTGHLMQKGFVLINMQPDLKGSGKNVFFFNDTQELRVAVDAYLSRRSSR